MNTLTFLLKPYSVEVFYNKKSLGEEFFTYIKDENIKDYEKRINFILKDISNDYIRLHGIDHKLNIELYLSAPFVHVDNINIHHEFDQYIKFNDLDLNKYIIKKDIKDIYLLDYNISNIKINDYFIKDFNIKNDKSYINKFDITLNKSYIDKIFYESIYNTLQTIFYTNKINIRSIYNFLDFNNINILIEDNGIFMTVNNQYIFWSKSYNSIIENGQLILSCDRDIVCKIFNSKDKKNNICDHYQNIWPLLSENDKYKLNNLQINYTKEFVNEFDNNFGKILNNIYEKKHINIYCISENIKNTIGLNIKQILEQLYNAQIAVKNLF